MNIKSILLCETVEQLSEEVTRKLHESGADDSIKSLCWFEAQQELSAQIDKLSGQYDIVQAAHYKWSDLTR